MNTSLQWLRSYLPDAPDAQTIGETLTHAGYPTETFWKFPPNDPAGDDIFDVEITSNRSDLLSHLGVR